MTELLYYPENEYQKEFDAEVQNVKEVDGYITLDKTLFYKKGGGQPSDKGKISWKKGEASVEKVVQENGKIKHFLEGELPEQGAEIHGVIDWGRRYKHMRMHTAQHLVSWVVLNMYDASTAGNQIHEDYSRIDFKPVDFDENDIKKIEKAVNSLIEKELEVEKELRPREKVEQQIQEGRTNLEIIPDNIDPLRVVIIAGEDICPCSGTHVENIEEIGKINITGRESKGANAERLIFELEE